MSTKKLQEFNPILSITDKQFKLYLQCNQINQKIVNSDENLDESLFIVKEKRKRKKKDKKKEKNIYCIIFKEKLILNFNFVQHLSFFKFNLQKNGR